ncbi:thioester reductase domain-containing protein [Nocardia sp. NPDC056000]|uniref:thioester reductase domain-containing protein n=1 Tax=Nocardia sp. NPDC056000 TaxID=3345674 RepID=UPI0035DAD5F9
MGERNGDAAVGNPGIDRRDEAESIERGGGGLNVAALLAGARGTSTAASVTPDDVVTAPTGSGQWDVEGLAAAIAAIAARVAPDVVIDVDTDFFDSGATSVAAVRLVAELAREHGVELALDDVFADARPSQLARRWLRAHGRTSGTALAVQVPDALAAHTVGVTADEDETLAQILADVALADRLPFVGPPPQTAPKRILLTGATGFLGSHMLLDLLRHSEAHVVCLVRGEDEEAGARRLADALRGFSLPWSAEVRRRITVLPGDIRSPRLGLSDEQWNSLALETDSIVSVAAAVDFLRGYSSLRQSNVLSALTLAELAVTGRIKPLHHVSSIAVFNEIGIASMGEDDAVAHIDKLGAGYDKTKWAAEAALRRAREHGLVVTFLRPGGIGGHRETGAHNAQDLSSAMLAAISRFRTVPAFRCFNVAPVDWVSRVSAAIVGEPSAWGFNYNLTGIPNMMDDVLREMNLSGMNVRVQDWQDWREQAMHRIVSEPIPELDFLGWMLQSPGASDLIVASLTAPPARCDRTFAFVRAHKLPEAVRYGAQAQQRAFELMAESGVARLPQREDAPYLWFSETMRGFVGAPGDSVTESCELDLTLSITSMYQLLTERRVDVSGTLACAAVHAEPLVVERGDLWIRPQQGVPRRTGLSHPLMTYRLRLRDADGGTWWLEGEKTARARRDVWRQVRALSVRIGPDGAAETLTGEVVVPTDTYMRDQIDGLRVNSELPERQQRTAKLIWLAWFGAEVGRGALQPMLRAAAELLDLRRGATLKELS